MFQERFQTFPWYLSLHVLVTGCCPLRCKTAWLKSSHMYETVRPCLFAAPKLAATANTSQVTTQLISQRAAFILCSHATEQTCKSSCWVTDPAARPWLRARPQQRRRTFCSHHLQPGYSRDWTFWEGTQLLLRHQLTKIFMTFLLILRYFWFKYMIFVVIKINFKG